MQEPLDVWFKREILQHEAALLRLLARIWPRKHEIQDLRQAARRPQRSRHWRSQRKYLPRQLTIGH